VGADWEHEVGADWEHEVGADWEQFRALNVPERSLTDLNEPTLTRRIFVSAGQRSLLAIVHTEGVLEPAPTALNYAKPLVNGRQPLRNILPVES
jgi:hypothetical protein